MIHDVKFHVKPWDDSSSHTIFLDIFNARNKYTNPDYVVEATQKSVKNWFSENTILSRDVLRFENEEGKIVGFAGLTNYSGSTKTWRIIHAILPEYFQTKLPQLVIEASIELGKMRGLSKLIFPIFGSVSAPFEKAMLEKGIEPVVYVYDMELSDSDSIFHSRIPNNVCFQENCALEDYGEYVRIVNEAFQGTFEFSETTIEDVKKHVEVVTSHGLDYIHCCAFLSGSLEGVCNYYYYPKEFKGVIESIFVSPSHQHQGIGSALLLFCIESMKKKGSKKIMATVRFENSKSLKFFEKFGFDVDENKVQKYYQIL